MRIQKLDRAKDAVRKTPVDVELRRQLARVYADLGRHDLALNHLKLARTHGSFLFCVIET